MIILVSIYIVGNCLEIVIYSIFYLMLNARYSILIIYIIPLFTVFGSLRFWRYSKCL